MKQDREQQQQEQQLKQKQWKKKQIQDDDDDTVITKITQESLLGDGEFGFNLIDDEDDKYDNGSDIVIIPTQVLFRMSEKNELEMEEQAKEKMSEREVQ